MSQKKPVHRAKILKDMSKKGAQLASEQGLRQQYDVIRKDIIKLRDDLQKGWSLARATLTRKVR